MRRPPPALWILAPLILGLLYFFIQPAVRGKPSIEELPPEDTILTWRFRNAAALNDLFPGPRGPTVPLPISIMARDRNVPRLNGVDPEKPIHWLLIPPRGRLDASMVTFPLDDADAFEAEFNDLRKIEQGYIRHAQYLEIQGDWAGVSHVRDAVRRMGTGGISIPPGDEDFAVIARIPALVDLAMRSARQLPWRPLLEAFGVDLDEVAAAALKSRAGEDAPIPSSARVRRLRDSWSLARMWAWREQGRVRVELEPTRSPRFFVNQALKALHEAPSPTGLVPAPPADAHVWLYVPDAVSRAVLSSTLYSCGVDFPVITAGDAETLALQSLTQAGEGDDGLLIWGERQSGDAVYALTVGIATPSLAPLRDTLGDIPEPGATMALPSGAAPFTVIDTGRDRTSPEGSIEHATTNELSVLTYGQSAKKALERFRTHLATNPRFAPPTPPTEGLRLVAAFYMDRARAEKILGKAVQEGGMLSVLGGGAIRGALWTDGKLLRLEAAVVGRTP